MNISCQRLLVILLAIHLAGCLQLHQNHDEATHQACAPGLKEYGIGAGYPWKFGDALNDTGMYRRCEKDHGKGNCEKIGMIVYPKCKSGYHRHGCCICVPSC